MLEYVRYTPSGYNAQPWEFLLIREPERLQQVQDSAFGQSHITAAGNAVVVLANRDFGKRESERILHEWREFRGLSEAKLSALKDSLLKDRSPEQKHEMALRNASLAAMVFLLAAHNMGYATCPMMGFSRTQMRTLLSLPDHMAPVLLIALGREDTQNPEPPQLPRKTPQDLGHFEHYGNQMKD